MLYLVNAAEAPAAAGYVAPEMELLAWVGKPVIVAAQPARRARARRRLEAAELARWRSHLAPHPPCARCCRSTRSRAAGSRRLTLLRAVEAGAGRRAAGARWRACARRGSAARPRRFDAAMHADRRRAWRALAMACARSLPDGPAAARPAAQRRRRARLGQRRARRRSRSRAARRSPRQLDAEARAEHAGAGPAARPRRQPPRARSWRGSPATTRCACAWTKARRRSGAASSRGALVGLKADLLSGGLTLGGGLLAGGLLGALGSAGLARCVNLVRGTESSSLAWNARGARRHRRGGAAALSRGGALRPRPRRLGRGRGAAALEGRDRARARGAARRARGDLVDPRPAQRVCRRRRAHRGARAARARRGVGRAGAALSRRRVVG